MHACRLDGQTAVCFDELWANLPANEDAPAKDDLPRCGTPGCRYYGLMEYSGKCLQCYKNGPEPTQSHCLPSGQLYHCEGKSCFRNEPRMI